MTAIHGGLTRTHSDVPLQGAYLEAMAGVSSLGGPALRLEGGARPFLPLSVFGFAQWQPSESTAGIGARWTF